MWNVCALPVLHDKLLLQVSRAPEAEVEVSPSQNSEADSKEDLQHASRSRQQYLQEGNHNVSSSSAQQSPVNAERGKSDTSGSDFVKQLVHDIMTKAAAEAKGVAAETKEAEKLAADAVKSPKPKDEVALKKGTAGGAIATAFAQRSWLDLPGDSPAFGSSTAHLSKDKQAYSDVHTVAYGAPS